MAKPRFRDVKQGKIEKIEKIETEKGRERERFIYPTKGDRFKAFITDSFMLLMPIIYLVMYIVMGGREGFAEDKLLGWLYIIIPFVIVETIFIAKSGQTPGMKAYNIKVIELSTDRVPNSVVLIIFRQLLGVVDFLLFGWLLIFFRRDHRTPHEIFTNTAFIKTDATAE
jgi:uncharacterized RDD family membrane protein YckC